MAEAKSLYNEVILDHIKNARNFQALDDADRKSHGINPLCGDTFNVYVKLRGDRVELVAVPRELEQGQGIAPGHPRCDG